jgi:hypothetical protein
VGDPISVPWPGALAWMLYPLSTLGTKFVTDVTGTYDLPIFSEGGLGAPLHASRRGAPNALSPLTSITSPNRHGASMATRRFQGRLRFIDQPPFQKTPSSLKIGNPGPRDSRRNKNLL